MEPLIDDAIIAHLNNIISVFQKNKKSQPSENDVQKSLAQLKKVKDMLQKINDDVSSFSSSSSSSVVYNDLTRSSAELKHGSIKKPTNSERAEGDKGLSRKLSYMSIKNSMTVSPCNFSPKSLNGKKVANKQSFTKLQKQMPQKRTKPSFKNAPKIIDSFSASCRIHRYDDSSHSFEIMQIKSNGGGDNLSPDVVIVALASGETAFFKATKRNNSFVDNFLPDYESVDSN